MNNNLPAPQYAKSLQMEDRSLDLLNYRRFPSWIVRPIGHRDLGIDGEVEMHKNGRPAALFLKFQLKSHDKIKWDRSGIVRSSPLAVASANYWLGVQKNQGIPVFLFEADLSSESVYFAAMGPQLRRNYDALFKQSSVTLEMQRSHHLADPNAAQLFDKLFQRECTLRDFVASAERCLFSLRDKAFFLLASQGRDGHMEVGDRAREQRIYEIYQNTCDLQYHLRIQNDELTMPYLPEFRQFVSQCQTEMGGSGDMLEYTMTLLCEKLEQVLPFMVGAIIVRFHDEEGAYWRREQPALFDKCAELSSFVESYKLDVRQPRRIRFENSIVLDRGILGAR